MIVRTLLLLLLMLGSLPGLALAEEKPYLHDLLKTDTYLAAWNGMLASETVPSWVKTLKGPATPATAVSVGGQAYTLAWLCKAHDCGDNQLYVLFSPDASKAWGLLIVAGDQRNWLGKPDAVIQAAILSGVQ